MNIIYKLIGLLAVLATVAYLFITVGVGIYNMQIMSESIGDLELSIPLVQMVAYMLFTTICLLLKRYRLGLVISFAFIFYWGFLHASAHFFDAKGEPTLDLYVYLTAGLTVFVLVLVSFMRHKAEENQGAFTSSAGRTSGTGQQIDICPTCHQGRGIIVNTLAPK